MASCVAYLSVWTPPEWRSKRPTSGCWSQIELRNVPALSLHLWSFGWYSWFPCQRNPDRSHAAASFYKWFRALSEVGFTSINETNGLLRSDNERPDGLTLIPRRDGRCVTWDVTVTDTLAPLTLACHLHVQPQQLKRRPNAKKINKLILNQSINQSLETYTAL